MSQFHELINSSQPGTMVQHLYSLNGGEVWLAGIAIREDWSTLARLTKRIDIHSRGAVVQVRNVHLILLMLQFEGTIYETFVSVQHEDSIEFVARMAEQSHFSILIFDGVSAQPVRAFVTQNGFQLMFRAVYAGFADWPGWAYAEFDQAKATLYERYPSVMDLWHALGQHAGGVIWQLVSSGDN